MIIKNHEIKFTEDATSPSLLEPDWGVIMKICDLINQGEVQYVLNLFIIMIIQISSEYNSLNYNLLFFS